MKGMITLRYCKKCNKDFDDDCYFCSYCGRKLDYDEDREPESFMQGLKKRKGHFLNVAFATFLSMIPFWLHNQFTGRGPLYILAHISGMFAIFTLILTEKSKDEMLFSYNISTLCFAICIICGMLCS